MKKYAIVVVVVLAFLLRLVLLNQSFWLDEAAQALESTRPLHQQLEIPYDFQPPLYHLTVHFLSLISTGEAWLRMTSLIPGVVTVVAIYLIAQTIWKGKQDKEIGVVAALFMTLSPLHVFYSQELRPYMFAAMWAALSWLMFLKFIEDKKHRQIRLFVIFTIAGLYSMYLYPFLLLSQCVFVWFCAPKIRKNMMIAVAVATVFFLPWVPSFLEQLRIGSELRVSLPGWSEVVSSPQWKALPLIWLKFIGGLQSVDPNLFSALYFGLPTLGVLAGAAFLVKQPKSRQLLMPVLFWLLVTILSAWVVSFIVPVLSVKRVLLVLPAFYLFIAAICLQIKNARWRNAMVAAFVVFELIGLWSYWTTPGMQREDWRAIHGEIYDNYSAESTLVLFGFDAPFAPWAWYDRKEMFKLDTLAFPAFPIVEPAFSQTMERVLAYKRVLVFDYLRDLTDPSRQIEAWLLSHGYQEGRILNTQNLGFVREFHLPNYVSTN